MSRSEPASLSIRDQRPRGTAVRVLRAVAAGLLTVVVMAIPTDVLDTPWFSREVPVRWWEIPVLAAVGVLVALWVGIGAVDRGAGPAVGGATLATFAIGCPICNKLVLAAVGTTGRSNCGRRCSRCWPRCRSR